MFKLQNRLEEGDACIFELLRSEPMTFKVIVYRIAGEQVEKNKSSPLGMGTPAMEATWKGVSLAEIRREALKAASTAMHTVLNKPGSFMIYISEFYISRKPKVVSKLINSVLFRWSS